jgi:hypothetical protein
MDYSCDWRAGFVMSPSKKQRVGYLSSFQGLDLGTEFLKPDIEVFTPYSSETASYAAIKPKEDKVQCVGVIESLSWGGGVGDPLQISAYISSENAAIITAKLKTTLKTNKVTKLGWWIVNFDEENKAWFEESYPKAPADVQGQINGTGGNLRIVVAEEPTKVANNIDTNVYNIYFEVIPAANSTYVFNFATSAKTPFVRNWGLKVGASAAAAMV